MSHQPSGIEALVCKDIAARQEIGLKKYGCSVAESPDDMLVHAYEEVLDLAVYLRAEMERQKRFTTKVEVTPVHPHENRPANSTESRELQRLLDENRVRADLIHRRAKEALAEKGVIENPHMPAIWRSSQHEPPKPALVLTEEGERIWSEERAKQAEIAEEIKSMIPEEPEEFMSIGLRIFFWVMFGIMVLLVALGAAILIMFLKYPPTNP